METGCRTSASIFTHRKVALSIQSFPCIPVSTLVSLLGG